MKTTLLVLAAGMGSRYGGLKQMDGLGPNGETIIDYSIYDAVNAGFNKVVYIVRGFFLEEFEQKVREKYHDLKALDGSAVEFAFVTQELDKIPAPFQSPETRVKPWGTAHALLMAKDVINEPFAVINGDDFYGRESFEILAKWLNENRGKERKYSIVGFALNNTLSASGGVSRGICTYNENLVLSNIAEFLNIQAKEDGKIYGDNSNSGENNLPLEGEALCSMNMWGFTPDYFELSEQIFCDFLKENITELKKEFYIPYAIDCMIKANTAQCEVLSTPSKWFGVTYKEDRPAVVAKLQSLVDEGIYPSPLNK